jgi:hypothetical protein
MRHRALMSAIPVVCVGCDYTALSTEVGEHVVYHWDSNEEQLCGGTVGTADRFVEAIRGHYGLPFEGGGPNVEYFWKLRGASNACSFGNRDACTIHLLSGFTLFTDRPIDTHELAHTTEGGYGKPFFLMEGFASRWQSDLVGSGNAWRTVPGFLSETELRAAFAVKKSSDVNYGMAHKWWVALETNFGPAKMGEFIAEIGSSLSNHDVEAALQHVLGISLAESAALAENLPELMLDDPACSLAGLPTLVWEGDPLVVDRGEVRCENDDIVTLGGGRVRWLFALEFPPEGLETNMKITVPTTVDPQRKQLVLSWCDGEVSLNDYMAAYYFDATHPGVNGTPQFLAGRLVAALQGEVEADGSVELPRVVFEESLP